MFKSLLAKFLWVYILIFLSVITVAGSCIVNYYVPIYAKDIVDILADCQITKDHNLVWTKVIIFLGLKCLQGFGPLGLITLTQQMLWLPIDQYIRYEIQTSFFRHIHSMSFSGMADKKLGNILGILDRGSESIASSIEHILFCLVPASVDIGITLVCLSVKYGWIYCLIIGFQLVMYVIFTLHLIEKRTMLQTALNSKEDELNQKALECLVNIETVKIYTNEDFEQLKYLEILDQVNSMKFKIVAATAIIECVQHGIVCAGLLTCSLVILKNIAACHDDALTVGDYVLCTTYLAQIYGPLKYLANYFKKLRVNAVNAEQMIKYWNEKPEGGNVEAGVPLKITTGSIQFKNVTLKTEDGKTILDNLSFAVPGRSTVALVGSSGSGKTSVARLLMRLYEPTSGEIYVDGVNINDVMLESLRTAIAIIPQDTSLFNDSLRYNISYGKLNASSKQIRSAAVQAKVHTKIMKLQNQYDTIVGHRGAGLSGGERQRIGVARAILKNSKIVICDEATSAVDVKTAEAMHNSLRKFCRNRTCVMITHNLSQTASADTILVLQSGRIVERGSHSVLLKKDGIYANMWRSQMKQT